MHDGDTPLPIYLQTHAVGHVVADFDLLLAALDDVRLRRDALAVGEQAASQLHAQVPHHVLGVAPRAAGRTQRDDGVVHRLFGRSSYAVGVPGVWRGVVAGQGLLEVERRRGHADRPENAVG